jgi:hypothetical protein
VRGLAARADELGGLEAVHARHVHVEQDHRALVVEQPAQRLLARGSGDDVLLQLLEDGAEDHRLSRRSSTMRMLEPLCHDRSPRVVLAG